VNKERPLISIHLKTDGARRRAAGILVCLYIEARERNNYPLGYFISDKDSRVALERKQIRSLVESAIADAPMDYAPDWESSGFLIVEIPDSAELHRRFKALRGTYPDSATELQELMQQASNENIPPNLSFRIRLGEPAELHI
jgi:hypothetical protein